VTAHAQHWARLRRREDTEKAWLWDHANSFFFQTVSSCKRFGKPPDFLWFHDDFVRVRQGYLTDCSRSQDARPMRAFLIRLEIGEMRNSVVKSFVTEIKDFIRFSSIRRPGG
jgi:hypothetical protein